MTSGLFSETCQNEHGEMISCCKCAEMQLVLTFHRRSLWHVGVNLLMGLKDSGHRCLVFTLITLLSVGNPDVDQLSDKHVVHSFPSEGTNGTEW